MRSTMQSMYTWTELTSNLTTLTNYQTDHEKEIL